MLVTIVFGEKSDATEIHQRGGIKNSKDVLCYSTYLYKVARKENLFMNSQMRESLTMS